MKEKGGWGARLPMAALKEREWVAWRKRNEKRRGKEFGARKSIAKKRELKQIKRDQRGGNGGKPSAE